MCCWTDKMAIESTEVSKFLQLGYHNDESVEDIGIDDLLKLIESKSAKEIILATSSTVGRCNSYI